MAIPLSGSYITIKFNILHTYIIIIKYEIMHIRKSIIKILKGYTYHITDIVWDWIPHGHCVE